MDKQFLSAEELILITFVIISFIIITKLAKWKGRSGGLFIFYSFILTPFLTIPYLLICKKNDFDHHEDDKTFDNEEIVNTNFWKHALNWKYYIFPFILGILILYYYIQTGEEIITKAKFLNILIGIIAAVQFRKQVKYKFLMFFVTSFTASLIMAFTYMGGLFLINTYDNNLIKKQLTVNNYLKQNKNLPKNLNEYVTLVKYINENNNAIISQFKVNDTKENVMSEFNNISDFEKFMLNNELEISCKDKNVQTILSTGLVFKIEYQDINGNILGIISLDKNKCDNYFSNKKE